MEGNKKLWKLFISTLYISAFTFGGGFVIVTFMKEFTDLITIAEMTPGPIAINSATFVGIRIARIPGHWWPRLAVFCRPVLSFRYWHGFTAAIKKCPRCKVFWPVSGRR